MSDGEEMPDAYFRVVRKRNDHYDAYNMGYVS